MSDKVKKALEARASKKENKEEDTFEERRKRSEEKVNSALAAREDRIKNNLQSTFSDLENSITAEIDAYKKLSEPSWGGGNESLGSFLDSTRQNRVNVENLIRKVEAHRKYFGDEKADTILTTLNGMKDGYNSYVNVAEVRSQYDSKEEYETKIKEAEKSQKDYEALLNYDTDAGEKEIAELEARLEKFIPSDKSTSAEKKAKKELEDLLAEKKAYYTRAKRTQNSIKLTNDALNAEDLDEYVQKGINTGNDTHFDLFSIENGALNLFTNNKNDHVIAYREDPSLIVENTNFTSMDVYAGQDAMFAQYMTDDEYKIYAYYYGKYGEEKAREYLSSIEETINARIAGQIYDGAEGIADQYGIAFVAGLDQFRSGMESLFSTEDYIASSPLQIAGAQVREDLADTGAELPDWMGGGSLGQVGYDLINTTSNMLPSILASSVANVIAPGSGAIIGAGLMGASASGNAYAEMLNLGYDKGQARLYSALVGVSEAGLSYALGGISKLGGKLSSKAIVGIANNFDNAIARVAVKLGGNALSEFSEEYLQEVLDPIFKNIALGTDEDVKLFSSEALYSGILGALSAGILEGGSTISSDIHTTNLGKNVQKMDGAVERLKALGTTFSADTVAHQIADKITEETGAYKIGLLLQEVGGTLSEQNVSDIVIGLTKTGMDESSAKKLAKTYQAFLNGEMSLTDEQVKVLEECDPLANVLRKQIIGSNTEVYQRTREYSDLVNLAMGMESKTDTSSAPKVDAEATPQPFALYSNEYIDTVAKEYEAMGIPTASAQIMARGELSATTQGKVSSAKENAVESKYEVSAEGKTINTKTDEIVNIKNIESISSDGEAKLTLDDGMVVKASDLSFGTDAEAIFVENIGAIKIGKNPISTTSANALYMTAMSALKSNPNMTATEAMSLIKGLGESYVYGTYNFGESKLTSKNEEGSARLYAGELSQEHRKYAYELGTKDAANKAEADQKGIDDLKAKAEGKTNKKSIGKIIFEKGAKVDESALTDSNGYIHPYAV